MILPDANIWIYALDAGFGTSHERARAWLDRNVERSELLIPSIVETEGIHYLARRSPANRAADLVSWFLSHPGEVAVLAPSVNRQGADLLIANPDRGIGGRDAAILVHAKRADAIVVTHDQALFRVARDWGLEAHDPIAEPSL